MYIFAFKLNEALNGIRRKTGYQIVKYTRYHNNKHIFDCPNGTKINLLLVEILVWLATMNVILLVADHAIARTHSRLNLNGFRSDY